MPNNKRQRITEAIKSPPHYTKWTSREVGEWLQEIVPSVGGLKQKCIEQEISGAFVHKLTENSLFTLGVKSFPSRISIMDAIKSLNSPTLTPIKQTSKSFKTITPFSSETSKSLTKITPSPSKTRIKISKKKRHTKKILKWFEQSAIYKKCSQQRGQLSLMWHKNDQGLDWKTLAKGDANWKKLSVFEAAGLVMVITGEPTSLKDLGVFYEDWFGVEKSFTALCPGRSGHMMCGGFEGNGYYWVPNENEDEDTKAETCAQAWSFIIDNNDFLRNLKDTKGSNATDAED